MLLFTEAKKEVSVVIIKPDAVQSGKAEEIMGEVILHSISIWQYHIYLAIRLVFSLH